MTGGTLKMSTGRKEDEGADFLFADTHLKQGREMMVS